VADEPIGDGQLFIYLNEAGAEPLLRTIGAINGDDHQHLMTEQWAVAD
jgi:hypothetical protein